MHTQIMQETLRPTIGGLTAEGRTYQSVLYAGLPVMAECPRVLEDYQVPYDIRVLSAHRSPEEAATYAREAAARGLRVIIARAGGAAHLAGAMAAHSTLPVIGWSLDSSPQGGFDAVRHTAP